MSKKPVILTGLRANNELHIGNYFGALLPLIDQVKKNGGKYQINLFIPDLHSITTSIDYSKLQSQIMRNLKIFVAAGLPLNDSDVHIYRQSRIPAHSELSWIMSCFTGVGEMERMTQYKDKRNTVVIDSAEAWNDYFAGKYSDDFWSDFNNYIELKTKEQEDRISVGLFSYPVLMATDILLYGAQFVPVGDDQAQHLEFTRDMAERMNNRFGELFIVPESVKKQHEFFGKDQGLRIKDLADPSKKMSKSTQSDKGVIFLQDDPELAKKKILSATTDSVNKVQYDPHEQPGVSNLIEIYALIKGKTAMESAKDFTGETQYGQFKQKVADIVSDFLKDFQANLARVDEKAISVKLVESEKIMNEQANDTLLKVQKAVGLR